MISLNYSNRDFELFNGVGYVTDYCNNMTPHIILNIYCLILLLKRVYTIIWAWSSSIWPSFHSLKPSFQSLNQ